jgi:hypothetical protein
VPKRNGVVVSIDNVVIRVLMDADNERPARPQTFQLRGKTPYVAVGDRFVAEASIIAGVPAHRADFKSYLKNKYDPLDDVAAKNPVDRYAAVKSLRFLPSRKKQALTAIEQRLDAEKEERVLLEAAGAGTALESNKAWECLGGFVWKQERADLRMEAVFILTELANAGARDVLIKIATEKQFENDEIRQAAVWGLGKTGLKRYVDVVPFLNDGNRDVVLHAIAAFGSDTPEVVVDQLIAELTSGDSKRAPAASEALRIIGSDIVLKRLITAARAKESSANWVLATLGRLPFDKVQAALNGDALLERLGPLLLLSSSFNWLAEDSVDIDMKFLLKQNL